MPEATVKDKLTAYLAEAKMMQLATATLEGAPWVCNVWFVADKNLNLYWISATTRRHSLELQANPQVAASVCLVRDPSESNRGALQIEGTAAQVVSPLEVAKALKLYVAKGIFTGVQVKKSMADINAPHRFYKLTPTKIILFDGKKQEYTPKSK